MRSDSQGQCAARPPDIEETTPLLRASAESGGSIAHEIVYDRFSRRQKRLIVAMVSFCGILPLFISGVFIPCIPQISQDLDTTPAVVSAAVSISIFGASMGGLTASSYSTFYGRRVIYLTLLPLLILSSFAVAAARSVSELMFWRLLQAFGASPGFSVGAGVIGDMYKLEERGSALGIFFACSLLGPAIAPFTGGFAAHYSSWRILQVGIGMIDALAFAVLYAFLPEMSHPGERGLDKVIQGQKSNPACGDHRRQEWMSSLRSRIPGFLNPISPLGLLRRPNLLLVCLAGFFILWTNYVLLVPIAYTVGKRYDIANEAIVGACFLPSGLGNMIGAPVAGRLSDHIVARHRRARGGAWYPEDRLRGTFYSLYLMPTSIIVSGMVTGTTWIENGTWGLGINLVCLFVNGLGVDFVLAPSSAYTVDIMQRRSAESVAANNAFRSFINAAFIVGILPMINAH